MSQPSIQTHGQIVYVSSWDVVEGYDIYPEGSREKRLLRCPRPAPYPFLKPGHKYLLKYSRERYPAQFWCEVLAYRLGLALGLPVPPAHVAIDDTGKPAALIEWFLSGDDERTEFKFPGGDFLQNVDPEFQRKKGERHSWALVQKVFGGEVSFAPELGTELPDWRKTWIEMMAFDALIGNTDRHQENWVIVVSMRQLEPTQWISEIRLGPFFDNGTSLGHELTEEKVAHMTDADIRRYILRGRAHLRWEGQSPKGLSHFKLMDRLLAEYPEGRQLLGRFEALPDETIRNLVTQLCDFPAPAPLTPARGDFLARLIALRRQELLKRLHATP